MQHHQPAAGPMAMPHAPWQGLSHATWRNAIGLSPPVRLPPSHRHRAACCACMRSLRLAAPKACRRSAAPAAFIFFAPGLCTCGGGLRGGGAAAEAKAAVGRPWRRLAAPFVASGREKPGSNLATRPAPAALNPPAEEATTPPQKGGPQPAPKKKRRTSQALLRKGPKANLRPTTKAKIDRPGEKASTAQSYTPEEEKKRDAAAAHGRKVAELLFRRLMKQMTLEADEKSTGFGTRRKAARKYSSARAEA